MALLLDIRQENWMREEDLRDELAPHLPGVPIYCSFDEAAADKVVMLASIKLYPGVAAGLPNLQLVQKLGAGVDAIVADPDLKPAVRVTRLKPDAPAREIAEFCLAYVLREQRNMLFHQANAAMGQWVEREPRETLKTTVGVLGLGHIGGRTAKMFAGLEFNVIGWSRTPRQIDGIDCRAGDNALPGMLGECDYVASILPSTPQTRGLFDAELLTHMKPGSVIINAGRGDLIVEDDLIAALDADRLGGAVLDVASEEPLPEDSPLWRHPKVTVTPHVSGWHLDSLVPDVVENYKRLMDGKPLMNEVDRAAGY
ncbi:MAG: glyoxylate/hydroxypyruvate reductase A [Rhizobiales bacterium]|nr:glyoxylate/hydroxypyruvate reductase A [Hyphomicrobiales bacterium]